MYAYLLRRSLSEKNFIKLAEKCLKFSLTVYPIQRPDDGNLSKFTFLKMPLYLTSTSFRIPMHIRYVAALK